MAALEYPCVQISDTSSVSAGAYNEALYGIGSALLWTRSSTCQGLTNAVGNVVRCPLHRARANYVIVCQCTAVFLNESLMPLQNNFYPNDGECIRPDTNPPNELQIAGALPQGRSWRFFLNRNSQACKRGATAPAMIRNGKGNGGVRYSKHSSSKNQFSLYHSSAHLRAVCEQLL
jgi:hypothetical protein